MPMQLRAYLESTGESRETFARRIGIAPAALYRYLAGARIPRQDVMRRIVEATAGAVQPNDFFACDRQAPSDQAGC